MLVVHSARQHLAGRLLMISSQVVPFVMEEPDRYFHLLLVVLQMLDVFVCNKRVSKSDADWGVCFWVEKPTRNEKTFAPKTGPSIAYPCDGTLRGCPPFFFQAEDGIRDVAVTGVQTCALPI